MEDEGESCNKEGKTKINFIDPNQVSDDDDDDDDDDFSKGK